MSSAAARRDLATGCSSVVTLRLLSLVTEGEPLLLEEVEQLPLPLEWAWSAPAPAPAPSVVAVDRPDPRLWGGRMALACFEMMLGRRPAGQLARYVSPRTANVLAMHTSHYVSKRQARKPALYTRPQLASLRCFQPTPECAEVTAVVHDGERFRALALRLDAKAGQWITTAFELG